LYDVFVEDKNGWLRIRGKEVRLFEWFYGLNQRLIDRFKTVHQEFIFIPVVAVERDPRGIRPISDLLYRDYLISALLNQGNEGLL
jgi:hypothetical protein